mmetsp:Transcript_103203/g.300999  ORF Transcript_103203/g.300999 Transcript_103203/m.300999 type:complete len:275 (+) Transcript_103203:604-1428(+)
MLSYALNTTMTIVVSSSNSPSCLSRAASISALGAACGVSMYLAAMDTASSLVSASQRPSEATMANLSSDRSLWLDISGSAMMPILRAQPSPMDRPIASPGFVNVQSSQTRCGPASSPSSDLAGATTPPLISIRSFSLGRSGLMSLVNGMASHLGSFASLWRRPNTARESPTLAQWSVFLLVSMQMTAAVLPLYSTFAAICLYTSQSAIATAFARALPGSLLQPSCAIQWPGMRLAASWDTWCPMRPWPSRTPKRTYRTAAPAAAPSAAEAAWSV